MEWNPDDPAWSGYNAGPSDGPDGDGHGLWAEPEPPIGEPPPEAYDDGYRDEPAPGPTTCRSGALAEQALEALRVTLAACHGATATDTTALTGAYRAAVSVQALIDPGTRAGLDGLADALAFTASSLEGGMVVDLAALDILAAGVYGPAVLEEHSRVLELAHRPTTSVEKATTALAAVAEAAARRRARGSAMNLVVAIDAARSTDELVELHRAIEPPTTRRAVAGTIFARSAADWEAFDRAERAGAPKVRFSSGYLSLDAANTGLDEAPGFVAPGEFVVAAAGTGHGKSSLARWLLTAMTADMIDGWGFTHGRTILAFTEEEAPKIVRSAQMGRGQRFHHLAHNVTLAKVGSSRKRLIGTLYDSVAEACRASEETGAPIEDFLPRIVMLDYVGGIHEEGESGALVAIEKTADLLMRGIAAWDPEMMTQFSGVDFETHTGRAWPTETSSHRVAVIGFSQLRQQDGSKLFFRSGKSQVADFAVQLPDGSFAWEPEEGDYRIPTRDEVYGSSVLLNHATTLMFMHRARPENNPVLTDPDGRQHLGDTRARFILPKTRNSASMPVVPMRFDSQRHGVHGQYYDDLGHEAIEAEVVEVTDVYQHEGDPQLPLRPTLDPFAGLRY